MLVRELHIKLRNRVLEMRRISLLLRLAAAPASGGLGDRITSNVPKPKTKMEVVPGKGIVTTEYDPENK